MNFYGIEYFSELLQRPHWEAKCLLGEAGLAFFPGGIQHAQAGFPGLTYRDDHTGTAIAGIVKPGVIELRLHRRFSDEHVAALWPRVLTQMPTPALRAFQLTYHGQVMPLPLRHRP